MFSSYRSDSTIKSRFLSNLVFELLAVRIRVPAFAGAARRGGRAGQHFAHFSQRCSIAIPAVRLDHDGSKGPGHDDGQRRPRPDATPAPAGPAMRFQKPSAIGPD